MSDENTPDQSETSAAEAQNPAQGVRMNILAQYIRDMSFENIVSQKGIGGADVQPEVTVQISLDARKRGTEHQYEVLSKYRVTSKNKADDSTLFLCEVEYAGIFHVEGVPEAQMHPFLLIECPRMLFPYVRRIVSDVTRDGGFPPVNLDPVDFVALYRSELARRNQSEKPEAQTIN